MDREEAGVLTAGGPAAVAVAREDLAADAGRDGGGVPLAGDRDGGIA